MTMSILLKNFLVCDGSMEKGRYASLLVDGGLISSFPAAPDSQADETVDGRGRMALIPGFVNAHTHAAMALLRGLGEEAPLMDWLRKKIWPLEARLKAEHVYWGASLAIDEMARNGVTAFGDMYFEMDEVVKASLEMGMRCAPCRGLVNDSREKLEEGLRLADTWKDYRDFVSVQLGPHAPYTVPFHFLREITALARDRDLGIHFHFLETEWELGYIRDELKMSPEEYLHASGISEAPYAVLAHCVWMDPSVAEKADFSRMAIVHNPKSNLKLGSGVMDLPRIAEKTGRIALGTDGAASNNRLDIWDEMRCAALLHKGMKRNPTAVSARSALRMATYEGAEALGFMKKGMIRPGWAADFVLVDLDRPNYAGIDEENAIPFLVYAGSSADVHGTMVAGKWIYRSGRILTADSDTILEQASKMRRDLLQ